MSPSYIPDRGTPAGRLWHVLSDFKGHGEGNPNVAVRFVWAQTLGTPKDDIDGLFAGLVSVRGLVAATRRAVEQTPGVNHALLLEFYERVETLVSYTNLDQPYSSIRGNFDLVALREIAHMAHELAKISAEPAIPADEITQFGQQVDAFFDRVSNSQLHPALRRALLVSMEEMRRAIARYRIDGAEAFYTAGARAVGEVWVVKNAYPVEWEKAEKDNTAAGMGDLIGTVLKWGALATIAVDLGLKLGPFAAGAYLLLQSGTMK
jgi:hypothetical protein